MDRIATEGNINAVKNSDRAKTIAKAKDFIKSKDLRRIAKKREQQAEVQARTSIINVFACTRISN